VKNSVSKGKIVKSAGNTKKKPSAPVKKTPAKVKTANPGKTVKKTVKTPATKKTPAKKVTKKPEKKAPVQVKKTPASKTTNIKKQIGNKIEEKVITPKPIPVQTNNLGLPDGSEFQQTNHRRPLIVFPK